MPPLILTQRSFEDKKEKSMHRCDYFMEQLLSLNMAVLSLFGNLILAAVSPEQADNLRWFFIPIIGASLASITGFLLNPKPEDRRIVSGRILAANCFAIGGAWFASAFIPWLKDYMQDPRAIATVSYGFAMFVYFVSTSIVAAIIRKRDRIAARLVDAAEEKLRIDRNGKPSSDRDS